MWEGSIDAQKYYMLISVLYTGKNIALTSLDEDLDISNHGTRSRTRCNAFLIPS